MIKNFFLFLLFPPLLFSLSYDVEFRGVQDPKVLSHIQNASRFLEGKAEVWQTEAALEARAVQENQTVIRALQAFGNFEAKSSLSIEKETDHIHIIYTLDPGPKYYLESVVVEPKSFAITSGDLGLVLGKAARPKDIIEGEKTLINLFAKRGYPLAYLEERQVIADQKTHTVTVVYKVATGPFSTFGDTDIQGLKMVCPAYVQRKVFFCEGQTYSPDTIACTQEALDECGLFTSIQITPKEEHSLGVIPMVIEVCEAPPRSIGFGLSYSTQLGAGFTAGWQHRNLFGMGERLSFDADILQRQQEVTVSYLHPDFQRIGQNLILIGELEYEKTDAYTERFASISALLEQKLTKRAKFTYGLGYKLLRTTRSDDDGDYSLLKVPLQFEWHAVDDPLDPTCGQGFYFKSIPTVQLKSPQFFYDTNQIIATGYIPFGKRLVFALKANVGSILGSSRKAIPSSERFYAGSQSTLRGYKYMTVSPISENLRPIGGRSMAIATLEARYRASETIGLAAFYDAGNVYSSSLPQMNKKILQSAGLGLRYYTPVGPLRLDIAFPLNPRKHFDSAFQLYFSIGQSF